MPVLALGVSYRHAGVDLLERLSVGEDEMAKTYRRLKELESVGEAVVLTTCNRVEVYAEVEGYHAGFQDLKRFLSEAREVPVEELSEPLYAHYEDDAAEHLFSVAAGLDSMVLGEPQILAQVRAAFRRAEAEGAAAKELGPLFQRAVRAGRRARSETGIGASPAAFVEAGLDLAAAHLKDLKDAPALVVGAGEMGSLAAHALGARGANVVAVLSRRPERAERLAAGPGARFGPLQDLTRELGVARVVVSSTASTRPVISAHAVGEAAGGRAMFLLDLAVPRDVEPEAREIPGVGLADIDDLRPWVAQRRSAIGDEIARARAIVDEEASRYALLRRAKRISPLIAALHDHGERIRGEEIARLESRLAALPERDREAVEALTHRIVARLLHEPSVRLKDLAGRGLGEPEARMLAELFGLDPAG